MDKKYENILIPHSWYGDLVAELGNEEPNEELAKNRLWYLYLSDITGEQVMAGDPAIDYTVQGLLGQLSRMRPEAENRDVEIARMRKEGMKSPEIAEIFGVTAGAIRSSAGWKNYLSY